MIKAGYSGSGINDIVYMGDVVNRAAHLAHKAGQDFSTPSGWGRFRTTSTTKIRASFMRSTTMKWALFIPVTSFGLT